MSKTRIVDSRGEPVTNSFQAALITVIGVFSVIVGVLSVILGILITISMIILIPISMPLHLLLKRFGRRGFVTNYADGSFSYQFDGRAFSKVCEQD